MADNNEKREADFNSNLDTLQRIGGLIKELHLYSRGMAPGVDNNWVYLQTLDRLFIESGVKFTDQELNTCLNFQKKIQGTLGKWGEELYKPTRASDFRIELTPNTKYHQGWTELKTILRDYELSLMKFMDAHGLLLVDKPKADESPESWDDDEVDDD